MSIYNKLLGRNWKAKSMGTHYQCSTEKDHDFLMDSPLMDFHVEGYQVSKWRGAKPGITSKAHHRNQMHKTIQ